MRPSIDLLAMGLAALFTTVGASGTNGRRVHYTRYPDGRVAEERGWIGAREEGVHRGWWPNGRRRFEYTYHEGVMNGLSREWFATGAILTEQRYVNGHEAGLQRMYWDDGRVRASYVVRDGRRYGLLGAKGCVTRDSLVRGVDR